MVACLCLLGFLSACSSGGALRPERPPSSATTSVSATPRPDVLVAVTSQGAVVVLDPATGAVLHTLAQAGTGDEISLTPSGADAYFEVANGCQHQIEEVPVAGGTPVVVATGSVPAVSPDGSQLAYVRQPFVASSACQGQSLAPSAFTLVLRTLATGAETTYPLSPQVAADGLPYPVDHLSWSSDSRQLAVSVSAPEDNEGWRLVVIDPATDLYYFSGTGVPVTGADPMASYYREGVFVPDGDLFVDRVCCAGIPVNVTSNLLVEIAPSTGAVVHQVAIGITANDHTSLVSDPTGRWLLYLSGTTLFVSENGARPTTLASGFVAADWV